MPLEAAISGYNLLPRTRGSCELFRPGERQPLDGLAPNSTQGEIANGNGNVYGNAAMYGGLSQLRGHVHGMHDAVHEDGENGHEDDVHVHGLHGDVPDVRQRHHAHVSDERKDVHDVRRNVHDVRNHVRGHGRRSDDEALCRDVPPLRRVLFDDRKDDEGRLGLNRAKQQGPGAAHSAPEPFAKKSGHGYARTLRESGKSSNTPEPASESALPTRMEQSLRLRATLEAPPVATSSIRSTVLEQMGQTSPTTGRTFPLMHIPQYTSVPDDQQGRTKPFCASRT